MRNEDHLEQKMRFLLEVYNREAERLAGKVSRGEIADHVDYAIK
jgi:hypothetical protein